jgi:hypothetical protein
LRKRLCIDCGTDGAYYVVMKRVNYHLTSGQVERLRALARETGLSVAEIIRRAVDEYLGRHDTKPLKER